ncbi:MAG: lysostaphin resistance A-like protein [Haloarculaceae archaeon]
MSATTDWGLFGLVAVGTALSVTALARASATAIRGDGATDVAPDTGEPDREPPGTEAALTDLTAASVFGNVLFSQGLAAGLLVLATWYADVPRGTLGAGRGVLTPAAVTLGIALGAALYVADEALARLADWLGVSYTEALRELLAPDRPAGWLIMLVGTLPVVAVSEELLFRAALIGGLAAGFPVPAWALALASSALFGLAHGAQGIAGVVVAGLVGLALAVAFLATDSLLVVAVAHYVVDALEFVVNEGLDV